jgi:cardiolipin synthase
VNIPNIITIFRIFLVPLVVWLMLEGRMQTAFLLFVIAGISDGLDGYLAKKYGWQTELGAYLDPLADKTLLVSIFVVLGIHSHLPMWLVIAVVSRDILIVGGTLLTWVLERPIKVQPLLISKVNTVGQIVLAATVLGSLGFVLELDFVILTLVWITGVLTIASAATYMVKWLSHMTSYEEPATNVKIPRPSLDKKHVRRGHVRRGKTSIARS